MIGYPLILGLQDEGESLRDEAFSLVQALPLEAHIALGLMLVGGVLLWLFGGKILKPLFGLAGVLAGGMLGLIVVPSLGFESVAGASGPLIGLAIGAVIGLVLSLIALKTAIVVAASLGFAAAGFLGATVYLSHNPIPDDSLPAAFVPDESDRGTDGRLRFENPYTGEKLTLSELTKSLREADSFLSGGVWSSGEDEAEKSEMEQKLQAIAARCEAIVAETAELAKSHWNARTMGERVVVAGATFGGLALGLFVGFFMPKRSASVITAMIGSAVWLTAAAMLIDAYLPSLRPLTEQSPTMWASVWGLACLIGVLAQLAGLGRVKEKKKSDAKPKSDQPSDDSKKEPAKA